MSADSPRVPSSHHIAVPGDVPGSAPVRSVSYGGGVQSNALVESDPYIGRPEHRYVDQFTNEWAWRFEDAFRGLAWTSADPVEFAQRLALIWSALAEHKQEMAEAWMAFVVRSFADVAAEMPLERMLTDRVPAERAEEQERRPTLEDSVASEREEPVSDDESRGAAPGTQLDEGHEAVSAAVRRTLARIEQQAGQGHEPPALGAS